MNAFNRPGVKGGTTMWGSNRRILALLGLAGLLLAGCSQGSVAGIVSEDTPVRVEKNADTGLSRLALSVRAAERLGIVTAPVADAPAGGGTTVPYAAVVYDKNGATWAYTNPESLVFVRAAITIDRIMEDVAILSSGPPVGMAVVTVGTAELWGVETGVGGGH
jgi:hypothetical protein